MVANTPGSTPSDLPGRVRVLENARPLRLAENVNLGVAATDGEWIVYSNPDVIPAPDAVGALHGFASTRPRCGIAGPRTVWLDRRTHALLREERRDASGNLTSVLEAE